MSLEIVLFKHVNGEEVIGKEVKEEGNKVTFRDVRVLMAQPGPNGQMAVAMIPWFVGAPDNDVEFDKSRIGSVPVGPLPKQLEDAYLQQTSGIQFAAGGPQG